MVEGKYAYMPQVYRHEFLGAKNQQICLFKCNSITKFITNLLLITFDCH